MLEVLDTLGSYASASDFLAYIAIFIGANIWGDATAIAGSILAFNGHLNWIPLILTVGAGAFLGDTLLYQIGKRLRGTLWGLWIESCLPYRKKVVAFFHENSFQALMLSKFIVGFNVPVLFLSGYCGVPFRTFLKSASLAALVWAIVIFPIGYLTAAALHGIGTLSYKKLELSVLFTILAVVLFRTALHRFGARVGKKAARTREAVDGTKETL